MIDCCGPRATEHSKGPTSTSVHRLREGIVISKNPLQRNVGRMAEQNLIGYVSEGWTSRSEGIVRLASRIAISSGTWERTQPEESQGSASLFVCPSQ
ncbi:hypothetical protein HPP92_004392 [Vanilla planifolia]|uniref:Uncharacterized protein n=1 Tax=Vanilla planifolia TaxID=51239 RepID=A0A835RWP3_VANPL|nr:hypothetical protein HPP92_004392 [Vanilla planifolia]